MAVRISIVEPSFKRSQLAVDAFKEWITNADRPEEIEHIVALDSNDPTIEEYKTKFAEVTETTRVAKFEINIGDSTNANQAMNRGAKLTNPESELLVMLSDDQGCFPHWDTELFKVLEGIDNFKDPKLIWADDGYWQFGTLITAYFANRAFYNRVGFIISDAYTSMFGDDELRETGRILNAIIPAPHLKFQHRHFSKGYTPYDETYARRNNQQEFDKGQETYLKRKANNFGL